MKIQDFIAVSAGAVAIRIPGTLGAAGRDPMENRPVLEQARRWRDDLAEK